jgi:hypothetical protein
VATTEMSANATRSVLMGSPPACQVCLPGSTSDQFELITQLDIPAVHDELCWQGLSSPIRDYLQAQPQLFVASALFEATIHPYQTVPLVCTGREGAS